MGVYCKWLCERRREQLNPIRLDESNKWPWGPKTIRALRYALTFGRWRGEQIQLVDDAGPEQDYYYDTNDWPDVGPESLAEAEETGIE